MGIGTQRCVHYLFKIHGGTRARARQASASIRGRGTSRPFIVPRLISRRNNVGSGGKRSNYVYRHAPREWRFNYCAPMESSHGGIKLIAGIISSRRVFSVLAAAIVAGASHTCAGLLYSASDIN